MVSPNALLTSQSSVLEGTSCHTHGGCEKEKANAASLQVLEQDLLHPSPAAEARKHKLKVPFLYSLLPRAHPPSLRPLYPRPSFPIDTPSQHDVLTRPRADLGSSARPKVILHGCQVLVSSSVALAAGNWLIGPSLGAASPCKFPIPGSGFPPLLNSTNRTVVFSHAQVRIPISSHEFIPSKSTLLCLQRLSLKVVQSPSLGN